MGKSRGRKRPLWGPLGLIVGGLLLFLFAAAGGFTLGGLSLVVADNLWQILLSAVGVGLIAAGGLLLAEEGQRRPDRALQEDDLLQSGEWRVTMIRPARFQRRMVIEGGYLNRPPDRSLRLFTVEEDGRFRPQSVVAFDKGQRRWSGHVDLGPGPYYSVYVVVAVVDAAGIALWDYFYQVGQKTDWELVGGSFEAFAATCDRFLVEGAIYG